MRLNLIHMHILKKTMITGTFNWKVGLIQLPYLELQIVRFIFIHLLSLIMSLTKPLFQQSHT